MYDPGEFMCVDVFVERGDRVLGQKPDTPLLEYSVKEVQGRPVALEPIRN